MAGKWWGDKNRPTIRATINPGITRSIYGLHQTVSNHSHSPRLARIRRREQTIGTQQTWCAAGSSEGARCCACATFGAARHGEARGGESRRAERGKVRPPVGNRLGSRLRESTEGIDSGKRLREPVKGASAAATAAAFAARTPRHTLRRVLALARFCRRGPVRVSGLSAPAVGIEPADVFAQRSLVHVEHVASAPAIGPGRVGAHQQQQEGTANSGTHLGSAVDRHVGPTSSGPGVGPVGTGRDMAPRIAGMPYASGMTVPGRPNERRPKKC